MKKLSKVLLAISFVLSLTTSAFATTVTAVSWGGAYTCLLYTSPSPRDKRQSRMPSSA